MFKNKFTDQQEKEIIKTYLTGKTLKETGLIHGATAGGILLILRRHGIKTRNISEGCTKHTINRDFFAKIDSHEKANILGFFWADCGLVETKNPNYYVLMVGLSKKDRDHLEWIRETMNSTAPVREYSRFVYWATSNRKISDDIQKLGIFPRKSLHIGFPTEEAVPKEYLCSFLLGVMEGDGSVGVTSCPTNGAYTPTFNIRICGTIPFCEKTAEVFLNEVGVYSTILRRQLKNSDNFGYIEVSGNKQVIKLARWLYSKCPHQMARKYSRIQKLFSLYDENGNRKYSEQEKVEMRNRQDEKWRKIHNGEYIIPVALMSPDHKLYLVNNITPFCKEFKLCCERIYSLAKDKPKNHLYIGWRLATEKELQIAQQTNDFILKIYPASRNYACTTADEIIEKCRKLSEEKCNSIQGKVRKEKGLLSWSKYLKNRPLTRVSQ